MNNAWVSIEGDSVMIPPFLTWLFSRTEVESPSIRLNAIILIDGNCSIDLMREDLESHSIVGPSLTRGLHGSAKIIPPSSVGGTLVVMEGMKRNCIRISIIGNLECNAIENPAVS